MLIHAMAALSQGAALTPYQYEAPELGPFDCLIKVKACGLCHSDIHIINGTLAPNYPLVPGHEVVGEVIEKGAMVEGLKIGYRVGVGWQRPQFLMSRTT
jgi:D-arabinose 1-dehydrogenase-like Zn-dependent alcohol dehydrogenase